MTERAPGSPDHLSTRRVVRGTSLSPLLNIGSEKAKPALETRTGGAAEKGKDAEGYVQQPGETGPGRIGGAKTEWFGGKWRDPNVERRTTHLLVRPLCRLRAAKLLFFRCASSGTPRNPDPVPGPW